MAWRPRRQITWKDRACGYETPSETFCRHNGIPYRGGCGSLEGTKPASTAKREAMTKAVGTLILREVKSHDA